MGGLLELLAAWIIFIYFINRFYKKGEKQKEMKEIQRLEALILHYYVMMRASGDFSHKQVDEFREYFGIQNPRTSRIKTHEGNEERKSSNS